MRVRVAGATPVVGHPPRGALRARGRRVSVPVRRDSRGRAPEADEPAAADAVDRDAVLSAVSAAARPAAVVRRLSAPGPRTAGTVPPVGEAREAGARRPVTRSGALGRVAVRGPAGRGAANARARTARGRRPAGPSRCDGLGEE